MNKTVVVIGTGYVGLPAAILMAQAGHRVIGVDLNENIVRAINDGVLHIKEEELQEILNRPEVRANLRAQTIPAEGDIFFIAVPTPLDMRKKVADLEAVRIATEGLVPFLRPGNLVVLESTVPPLTCREVLTPILEKSGLKVGENLFLAHCPERILPGDVFKEIVYNDRIIGAADDTSRRLATEIYASFVKGQLLQTDDVTAEFCKLCENTYRDVNIALANELNAVAETLGIDGKSAFALSNRHPRVNILTPGIGVGGHCIPIDPWFIKEVDPVNSRMIFASRLVNDEMPHRIAAKIRKALASIANPKIVAIGASYKANVEDLRESPAIEIVHLLKQDGYSVTHLDPLIPTMQYTNLADAAQGADALIVLVQHSSAMQDLHENETAIKSGMRNPIVLVY